MPFPEGGVRDEMTSPVQGSAGTENEKDVLERLTWGGCLIPDPKVLPLYYLCPYLPENHEERQHEGHHCQQASERALDP